MKTKNAIILMFISLLFINCKQSKECEKTNTEMDKTSKKAKVMKLISENTKPGESNVTLEDVALLKKTIFFSKDDEANLKLAGEVLKDQIEDVLDVWYGYVGSNEHLLYYFNSNDKPSPAYLGAVRNRFAVWINDLCNKPYDQEWLDYQHEIALRHHTAKKNKTDKVENGTPIINYRYMIAFIYPITATIKPFLAKKGHSVEMVNKMHDSWFKAIVLSTILWTEPYINDNEF
jgi:hypothetical protein|tara:strand:+ start:405 stop:1100 length:696 start_codon:yes stop_codon:yes gene_type:complete